MCNTCICLSVCLHVCLTGPHLLYNYVTSFSRLRSDPLTQRVCLSVSTLRSLLCCKVDIYNHCSRNELDVEYKPSTICSPVISHCALWHSVIRYLMERVKPDSLLDILRLYKTRNLITIPNSFRLDPILDTSNTVDILSPRKTQFSMILSSTDRQHPTPTLHLRDIDGNFVLIDNLLWAIYTINSPRYPWYHLIIIVT